MKFFVYVSKMNFKGLFYLNMLWGMCKNVFFELNVIIIKEIGFSFFGRLIVE